MMRIDYQFAYIRWNNDNPTNLFIDKVGIKFSEGSWQNINDPIDGELKNTYVREKQLKKSDLESKKGNVIKDEKANEMIIFTNSDFGNISKIEDLRIFLNKEIAMDKNRIPIDKQTKVS